MQQHRPRRKTDTQCIYGMPASSQYMMAVRPHVASGSTRLQLNAGGVRDRVLFHDVEVDSRSIIADPVFSNDESTETVSYAQYTTEPVTSASMELRRRGGLKESGAIKCSAPDGHASAIPAPSHHVNAYWYSTQVLLRREPVSVTALEWHCTQ